MGMLTDSSECPECAKVEPPGSAVEFILGLIGNSIQEGVDLDMSAHFAEHLDDYIDKLRWER